MELRHLRYFVGVAETENVSRAALKLHISQPAVSRQVRDLEDEIGLPLLKRAGKSVSLTQAGRTHTVEYKNALTNGAWQVLQLVGGNGALTNITDNTATGASRYYRVSTQ